MSSDPAHGEVYSIQHYVIKFVRDLRQFGGFFLILLPNRKSVNYENSLTLLNVIVLFMCMLSFIFLIVCGHFERKRICAGFLSFCLYMYCSWRSSYQEGMVGISSIPPYFCAWIYLMCFHVQWFKVIGGCSCSWYWWHGWQALFKLSFHNGFSWVAIFHLWRSTGTWFSIFLSHYSNKFFLKSYTTDLSQCFNIMNVARLGPSWPWSYGS